MTLSLHLKTKLHGLFKRQDIEKNEIMPFEATWMDLEIIILSEVRERQIPYNIVYVKSKV